MTRRTDVTIPAEGVDLAGWLYLPDDLQAPAPAITMAHGYAGTREMGLEPFAEAFADAGYIVLLHDHRTFGRSGGTPRQDVDPWVQLEDWRRAITYLETRPEVDADRIGLWGTSYAGGHALVLGATDRRLRCVVAQVPTISGFEQGRRRVVPDLVGRLEESFAPRTGGCWPARSRATKRSCRPTWPRRRRIGRPTRSTSTCATTSTPTSGRTRSPCARPVELGCTSRAPGSTGCRLRRC